MKVTSSKKILNRVMSIKTKLNEIVHGICPYFNVGMITDGYGIEISLTDGYGHDWYCNYYPLSEMDDGYFYSRRFVIKIVNDITDYDFEEEATICANSKDAPKFLELADICNKWITAVSYLYDWAEFGNEDL